MPNFWAARRAAAFLLGALLLTLSAGCMPGPLVSAPPATGTATTPPAPVCRDWVQVTPGGFDLGGGADGSFRAEEGFETLVFGGRLYLGLEADNSLGARLLRTRAAGGSPQTAASWEETAADPQGRPFGLPDPAQNDHIDSLAEFQGYLYASTANRGAGGDDPAGFRLYRSQTGDPGSWQDAQGGLGPGFGDPHNENFKDMQVFAGWLCGGTWNEVTGAQVWCTPDGEDWHLKNTPGFGGAAPDPANRVVWSGLVFDGALYFGVQNHGADPQSNADDEARLFRTFDLEAEPAQWEPVFSGPPGSTRADLLGALDGSLYLAHASPEGIRIFASPSGAPGSWQAAAPPGLNGDATNRHTVADGAAVFGGALFVAVANPATGLEIWRALPGDPPVWEQQAAGGFGDPQNVLAQLAVYNGDLYAWVTNYESGAAAWRGRCQVE